MEIVLISLGIIILVILVYILSINKVYNIFESLGLSFLLVLSLAFIMFGISVISYNEGSLETAKKIKQGKEVLKYNFTKDSKGFYIPTDTLLIDEK